jgi:hypothetical protein
MSPWSVVKTMIVSSAWPLASNASRIGEVWGDVHDGYRWDPEIAADAAKWLTEKAPGSNRKWARGAAGAAKPF